MIYLALALLFNVIVSSVLKLFPRYEINSLQAISVNYAVCVVTGIVFTDTNPFTVAVLGTSWLPWALATGVVFIGIFYLMAYCTKVEGMAATVIANKLSLVIPVAFSMMVYGETTGIIKGTGLLMALPAVYLTTMSGKARPGTFRFGWVTLLFFLSGGLDTLMNFITTTFLDTPFDRSGCTILTFATASVSGFLIATYQIIAGKAKPALKNLFAGIVLGVPNFFSIYFLVQGLHSKVFQSSATIPILNISILVATALVAIVIFRERTNKWQAAGLGLAIISILMIALGDGVH
ncbi:MAG: hypothetical protein KF744_17365 [Taibaiella sp.]|nr:hypothetical protein [Taibaiella sp.]